MEHIYQNIDGWFTFDQLYREVVRKFDNGVFVEIGAWLGKSTSFMAVEIINQNKNIQFYCVDTWEGSDESIHKNNQLVIDKKLFDQFLLNIEPVKNKIIPYRMTSTQASKLFENNSVDFCFIDGDHSYEGVKNDLENWYPKVKKGGIIAGHDYPTWETVKQAVDDFILKNNLHLYVHNDLYCWSVLK